MFRSLPVRSFEQLESRSLLSGCSVAAGVAAGLSAATSHHDVSVLASSRFSGSTNVQGTFLSATLSDPADANVDGKATFTSITHNGTTTTVFTASIKGAAAMTPYEVDINGTAVGTITTDADGSGKLVLTGSLPVTVAAGDTVAVGTATGTLAVGAHHGDDGDEGNENEVHLAAQLADTTGAVTGTANFSSETEDGSTESKLTVTIKGATASTDIPVLIDGNSVGTISTDANGGQGSLVLKNAAITVNEGSTIAVDTATGTFAVAAEVHVVDLLHLRSRVSDTASGATGTAIFMSRTLSDGTIDSKLFVHVHGATANSTLNVAIDGTVVGTVDTDANGNGHAVLTNLSVTPAAGSAISVDTTITGTLDAKANLGLHLARRGRD